MGAGLTALALLATVLAAKGLVRGGRHPGPPRHLGCAERLSVDLDSVDLDHAGQPLEARRPTRSALDSLTAGLLNAPSSVTG
ncbi:hypothetical protein [Streptomyces sp. HUCO-GS316]|uniref:hypothetical protein n=1 Tax=Streptomyces sp. HUCO-GS316 TaxID=2692198 RepID=UPI0019294805